MMGKFRFRLATIEKHRKIEEENFRSEMLKHVNALREVEKKLTELDSREVWARREYEEISESGTGVELTGNGFWLIDKFIQGQAYRREKLKEELKSKELEVAAAYNSYLEARKKRMTVEKLREKKLKEFKRKQLKKEIKETDDLNIMRRRLTNE